MKNWQFFQKFFYLMCAVKISLGNLEFLTPLWYFVVLKVCSIDIGSFFKSVQFDHFKGLSIDTLSYSILGMSEDCLLQIATYFSDKLRAAQPSPRW